MKKATFILYLLFTLLLVGCGDVKMSSHTIINKDGSGDFTFLVSYDDIVASYLNNELFSTEKLNELKENGFTTKKYYQDSYNTEEISYHFSNLKDSNILNNSICSAKIEKHTKLKYDIYSLSIDFKEPLVNSLTPLINQVAMETMNNSISTKDYLKDITIVQTLELPGEVIATNAVYHEDNILAWSYKLNQIDSNTTMNVTYKVMRPTRYNTLIFVNILLISIIIFIGATYYKKRKYS